MSKLLKDYEYLSYIASIGDLIAIAVEIVHSINTDRAPSWPFVIVVFVTAVVGTLYGIVTKITSVTVMGFFNTLLTFALLCIKIQHFSKIHHKDEQVRLGYYKTCLAIAEKECKASENLSSDLDIKENFPSGGQVYCL